MCIRDRGWTLQTMNNSCGISFWKWNTPGSAWYAQHLWEHYAFGQDKEYLRKTAYPVLKEVCQFWEGHLKERADGKLVAPNGWSPEHGPTEDGVTYDQEIIYDLFTNTIEAADALGDDQEFRDRSQGCEKNFSNQRLVDGVSCKSGPKTKTTPKTFTDTCHTCSRSTPAVRFLARKRPSWRKRVEFLWTLAATRAPVGAEHGRSTFGLGCGTATGLTSYYEA